MLSVLPNFVYPINVLMLNASKDDRMLNEDGQLSAGQIKLNRTVTHKSLVFIKVRLKIIFARKHSYIHQYLIKSKSKKVHQKVKPS